MSWGGFEDASGLRGGAVSWLLAGWRDHDVARVRAMAAPDFSYDLVGRESEVGIDWYLGFLRMIDDSTTDLRVDIRDTIVEGDDVGVHMVFGGRQTGRLFGVEARGATGELDVMSRLEFRGRRVARQSTITDFSTLQAILRQ